MAACRTHRWRSSAPHRPEHQEKPPWLQSRTSSFYLWTVSINLFIGEAERRHGDDIWLQVETGETCRDPAGEHHQHLPAVDGS